MLVRSVKTAGAWQEACWPCFETHQYLGSIVVMSVNSNSTCGEARRA